MVLLLRIWDNFKKLLLKGALAWRADTLSRLVWAPIFTARMSQRRPVGQLRICGLIEIFDIKDFNEVVLDVKVAVPWPEKLDQSKVLEVLPFGQKNIQVEEGGMRAPGLKVAELGDTLEDAVVAIAAVVVWVNQ